MDKLQEIVNKLKYIEGYLDGLCWADNDDLCEALDSVSREIAELVSVITGERK